jgi:predicted nucleotidyltransferase
MFTKDNRFKVMELFFKNPTKEFYLREIARLTGLSPPGVLKIMGKLERESLIEKEAKTLTTNYKADTGHDAFTTLKRAYNLFSVYESGLLEQLVEFYAAPEAIVLFGSYARAEDIETSDIDIAVITDAEQYPGLEGVESTLQRRITIHLIKDVKKVEKEFKNTLANGIVLHGYLEIE